MSIKTQIQAVLDEAVAKITELAPGGEWFESSEESVFQYEDFVDGVLINVVVHQTQDDS